jgi:hypothetical protein
MIENATDDVVQTLGLLCVASEALNRFQSSAHQILESLQGKAWYDRGSDV